MDLSSVFGFLPETVRCFLSEIITKLRSSEPGTVELLSAQVVRLCRIDLPKLFLELTTSKSEELKLKQVVNTFLNETTDWAKEWLNVLSQEQPQICGGSFLGFFPICLSLLDSAITLQKSLSLSDVNEFPPILTCCSQFFEAGLTATEITGKNLEIVCDCVELCVKNCALEPNSGSTKQFLSRLLQRAIDDTQDKIAFRISAMIAELYGTDHEFLENTLQTFSNGFYAQETKNFTEIIQRQYAVMCGLYSLLVLNSVETEGISKELTHRLIRDTLSLSAPGTGAVKKVAIGLLRHLTRDESSWSDLVQVLEAMEESQVHLVAPVLPKLNRLLVVCCGQTCEGLDGRVALTVPWVLIPFRLGFRHPNGWIRLWLIQRILELDSELIFHSDPEFVFACLIPALNDMDLFRRLKDENLLTEFLRNVEWFFCQFLAKSELEKCVWCYSRLLKSLNSVSGWQPVPLFYISLICSRFPNKGLLHATNDLEEIRKVFLRAMVVQVLPLRKGIFQHWINIICDWFQWNENSADKTTLTGFLGLLPENLHETFRKKVEKKLRITLGSPTVDGEVNTCAGEARRIRLRAEELVERKLMKEDLDEKGVVSLLCPAIDLLEVLVEWKDMQEVFFASRCFLEILDLNRFEVESSILSLWRHVKTMKKTEFHLSAVEAFLELALQPRLFSSDSLGQQILCIVDELMDEGEMYPPVCLVLSRQMHGMIEKDLELFNYSHEKLESVLLRLCVFGPILRKEARTTQDALRFMAGQKGSVSDSQSENLKEKYLTSQLTRTYAIVSLLRLIERSEWTAERLLNEMIEKSLAADQEKTASVGHSPGHRMKTRCMQIMLLLERKLNSEVSCAKLMEHCVATMKSNSQQNSVKLLTEWILARLCLKSGRLEKKFLDCHDEELENMFKRTLPWCQTQNFLVRCTAQAVLKRLWLMYCTLGMSVERGFAPLVQACVESRFENRNQLNLVDKLADDFWFSRFDVEKNYTFEDIFHSVPAHTNLPEEELIKVDEMPTFLRKSLGENLVVEPGSEMKIVNLDSSIWKGQNSPKPSEYVELCKLIRDSGDTGDGWQKKLVPVVDLLEKGTFHANSKPSSWSFVLVASLLEKSTNIGGLCRTCEIFGVSELVLGNKNVLDEQIFKSLSVSSENWLRITEVKPYDLSRFLREKKSEGYSVVGLEQTTSSLSLKDHKFAQKTVMVLGNERLGIPVEVMQKLDCCLEIPQSGVIRSLNVHVAGALVIFEAFTQKHHRQ